MKLIYNYKMNIYKIIIAQFKGFVKPPTTHRRFSFCAYSMRNVCYTYSYLDL
jgi:predicted KAP-like P-loop ATPase